MIYVYHATPYNPSGGMITKKGEPVEVLDFPDAFMLVATVVTDHLETAWTLTNNIDASWILNSGVTISDALVAQIADAGALLGGGCRSTSMGDVMVKDGEAFVAVSQGFQSIGEFDTGAAAGSGVQVDPGPDSGSVEVEVPVQVPKYQSDKPYQLVMARADGTVGKSWTFTSELDIPDLEDLIEAFEKDLTQATIEMVQRAEVDFKEKSRNILEAENRKEAKNE